MSEPSRILRLCVARSVLISNRVLRAFSEDSRQRLQPHLEAVRLSSGRILYEPGDLFRHVLFPENGVISLLALTSDGAAVEVAMIGSDAFVGLPTLTAAGTSPYQVLVQLAGDVFRLRAEMFRAEFRRDVSVQDAVLEQMHVLITHMAQSGVCNRYHTARQRLCRWLLMTQDRARTDSIPLTQEFLGHMLGANRKRVSHAAAQLQDVGCIRQRHGLIRILDRRGLEQRACECYRALGGRTREAEHGILRPIPVASSSSHRR